MALIKCSDCGRDVSDAAPACPNCGRPMTVTATTAAAPPALEVARPAGPAQPQPQRQPAPSGQTVPWKLGLVVLAGLLVVVYINNRSPSHSSTSSDAKPIEGGAQQNSAALAAPAAAVADPAEAARRRQVKETFMYGQNAQARKDFKLAAQMYEKACEMGEHRGCADAGFLYAEGKKGLERNYAKALALDTKACEADDGYGCNGAGILYANGKGVHTDWVEALALFMKACRLADGNTGCDNVKVAKWRGALDASSLWRAYNANEVAADDKFKGRDLTVTGSLQSVEKDFTGDVLLHLRSPNQFMPTRAYLRDGEAATAARLKRGQKVLLGCTCTGRTMGSPVLKDCGIVDSASAPRYDDDDE
jgi:hypothetical protein